MKKLILVIGLSFAALASAQVESSKSELQEDQSLVKTLKHNSKDNKKLESDLKKAHSKAKGKEEEKKAKSDSH
jgi:hypothetical protein